jgi:hypothetical protein
MGWLLCGVYDGRWRSRFGLFVFQNGRIVGSDPLGVRFDGTFDEAIEDKLVGTVKVTVPANGTVVQGTASGPNGMTYNVEVMIDGPPSGEAVVRQETPLGPVNIRFEKLRDLA